MDVIVIGLGSMGKRRIRLLKKMYPKIRLVGVDEKEDKRIEVENLYNIQTFFSINEAKKAGRIQHAFVCTAPLAHSGIIHECLVNGWNVFTELNLVSDGYDENIQLAKKNKCILFLSSTFYYREEIKYINQSIKGGKFLNYIYHVGQYLPDWHPWENYQGFFVSNPKTNGCREILAIELPWLIDTFGDVKEIHVLKDKMTKLDIAYNDNYFIELKHENENKGLLVVDVVCPTPVRNLEVYGENEYISWNGNPTGLYKYNNENRELENVLLYEDIDRLDGYSSFVVENAYRNEIEEFFAVIEEKKEIQYGFEKDFEVLKLIDQIEE